MAVTVIKALHSQWPTTDDNSPLSHQRHRGRARTPHPPGQRGNIVRHPIVLPRTRKARVEARRLFRMTAGAGRLDRSFGVRVLVAVAFVAFDASGFRRLIAVRDAVISVLNADAFTFIRRDRAIRPLVAGETLLHFFHLGVFVGVMTILTLIRVFRLCVVSMIEILDDAPLGMLSPLVALFRIA